MNETDRYFNPLHPVYVISGAPGVQPDSFANWDCVRSKFITNSTSTSISSTPPPASSSSTSGSSTTGHSRTKVVVNLDVENAGDGEVEIEFNINVHQGRRTRALDSIISLLL